MNTKSNLLKSIFISLILVMGVSNAWAASTVTGGHIYFDELNSGYTGAGDMQFWVGHNSYSCSYRMSKIDNTKLWYCTAPNWSDASYFAFTSGANWGGGNEKYYDRIGSNPWKSAIKENYALDSSSKLFVFRVASTANKAAVISDSPYGYQGTSYTSLNKTITIKAKVSTDGGSSYSEASTPAKLTGSSKVFTSTSSCAGISGASATLNAGSSSTTFKAGYTANTTLTAVVATGYTFAGWYTDSKVSSDLESTVNPAGATTYYAYYKAHQYTVKFDANGGTGSMSNQSSHTYGVSKALTANAFTRTGYTFAGWNTKADGTGTSYTNKQSVSNLSLTDGATITLYAQWTANTYTVTLDQTGATTQGTASVTATYDADMPSATMPTKTGYVFGGYYDQEKGQGTQYYKADGTSARTWNKADKTTLYAYFVTPQIEVTLNGSTFEPGTASVTATATVTPAPANGTTSICWSLLYSGSENKVAGHEPEPTNGNSVQFPIGDLAAGSYIIKAILREGTGCEGTEISSATQTFRVASNYTVTVKYMCGDQIIKTSTTVPGHATEPKTLKADDIFGYTFSTWEAGDGVEIKTTSQDKKTITYTAIYDGNLTATYTKNQNIIYFYNTLGWENVYVYFYSSDKYWDNNKGSGSKKEQTFTNGDDHDHKPHYREYRGTMTHIAGTQIWYYDCSVHGNEIKGYTNVVFNKFKQDGYDYFFATEVVRRGDYNKAVPMYVPIKAAPEYKNYKESDKTTYYNKGYWMNYPENTGYKLQIYDGTDNGAKEVASVRFPYSTNTIMPLTVSVDLEAGKTYGFKILREDNTYFSNSGTMTANSNGWSFTYGVSENCGLKTTLAGDYTFTLKYAAPNQNKPNDYQYCVDVVYPVSVGDYRVVYTDNAEWSQTAAHDANWYHPSYAIKKNSSATEEKTDIVSFFIAKNNSPAMKFQKCTAINGQTVTWADVENGAITPPKDKTETSVYNFIVKQPAGGASISVESVEPYTGNYYIRVDAMDGKWGNYKTNPDNRMTYSAFSESEANKFGDKFSHYATKWCEEGTNVKFTIANDYSPCISDTLIQDNGNPFNNIDIHGNLTSNSGKHAANIRFMWNRHTNKISRAYVAGSTFTDRQFLILKANKEIKNSSSGSLSNAGDNHGAHQAIFSDTQNWIYER
ncbi:MAG: InlB B-repeat-containing protein, partial [Paludibacteraceae bacterium]|nr:InlB B-repeat-containing protein [Paludibacteraceae bacterium]